MSRWKAWSDGSIKIQDDYYSTTFAWDEPGGSVKKNIIIMIQTGSVHGERANFTGLVLGCIEASKLYVQSLPEKKRDPGARS